MNPCPCGYLVWTICPRQLRGACQIAAVREAVEFGISHRMEFHSDIAAIAEGLKKQKSQVAMGAYNHLYEVLEGTVFRNTNKQIRRGMINVISLKGINPKAQKRIAEILLCVLWRQMRMNGEANVEWTLIIDEFQNLDFEEGAALFQMLTEARKYNLSLILATQTLSIFTKKQRAILNQASVQLFFRPGKTDIRQVASWIDTTQKDRWETALKCLRVGEAIAVGDLQMNGRDISQPIITRSSESVYSSQYAIENCAKRRLV